MPLVSHVYKVLPALPKSTVGLINLGPAVVRVKNIKYLMVWVRGKDSLLRFALNTIRNRLITHPFYLFRYLIINHYCFILSIRIL